MEVVTWYPEKKLKLSVNREKSGLDRAAKRKFLGLRVMGRADKARLSIAGGEPGTGEEGNPQDNQL